MWSRLMLAVVLAFVTMFGAVPVEAAASGATLQTGTYTFPSSGGCFEFLDVGFQVCGTSGTVKYHLVFPPNGGENSWFQVQDFTGIVTQLICFDPICSLPLANANAMIQVHLGPSRPNFILVNHSSAPLPHKVPLPPTP